MNSITKRARKEPTIVMIGGDEGRFICGKPWNKCHAERGGKTVPITEELMASTIWWWRSLPRMPDDLTKMTWLRSDIITTGARHEWRLLWEATVFFYELHARLGNDGFLFGSPARFISKEKMALLMIAEMHLGIEPSFVAKFKELVVVDWNTEEGKEVAYNAVKKRKSGRQNTSLSRKARPWHLIEVLDKKMLLSPPYVTTDGERSGISKIKREYLTRRVTYSWISSHGAGTKALCKQDQFSSSKAQRKAP